VRGLEPEGKGKLVRATPAIIKCEGGQVFLAESAAWREEFVAECVQFTGDDKQDAHDDQVDCLAYAVQQLNQSAPTGRITPIDNPRPRLPQPGMGRPSHAARRRLFGTD
jgi:phage terminase large subunit-like protein